MLEFIKTLHGYTAMIATFMLIVLLIVSLKNYFTKTKLTPTFKKLSLVMLIFFHVQLLLGVALLFINNGLISGFSHYQIQGKISLMEHIPGNFLTVLMVTLYYSKQKRSQNISVLMLVFLALALVFLGRTYMLFSGVLN